MLSSFVILFREALEVSLVVGIVFAFLGKADQKQAFVSVWAGLLAGIASSLLAAWLFLVLVGEFEGSAEQLFEGFSMAIAALLLFPVLSWLSHQNASTKQLTGGMHDKVSLALRLEVFVVVFASVVRDGVETVLFLGASSFDSPSNNLIGGSLGLLTAATLGYLMFSGTKKVPLKPFFFVTNTLLVFLGAGLASRALGEFAEAGWVPGLISPVWDLNPPALADGSVAWWHEDGLVGGLFKSLFGYVGAPNLVQAIGYVVYLSAALLLLRLKSGPTKPAPSSEASS